MTRGKRTRVARGVYKDAYGLAAVVTVGHLRQEHRFPSETDLVEIKRWQARTRGALADEEQPAAATSPAHRGTLDADITRYLKQIAGRPSYQSEKSHLGAWRPAYGARRRSRITQTDVAEAIGRWTTAGCAPQTIIHRCRVLRRLYRTLDGEQTRTPVDHVKRPAKPQAIPITVPLATIHAVHARLRTTDPLAAARFGVLAMTGQRPSQVMRAEPKDVDLQRGIWLVRPVKGTLPRELFLNADMRRAWRDFIKLHAWGTYSSRDFAVLLRACGWPPTIRPYNLRHSFAVAALEAGIDLGDVQGMLGHTEIETTRAFYAPILQDRLRKASRALEGRWGVPRRATEGATRGTSHHATSGQKTRKRATGPRRPKSRK